MDIDGFKRMTKSLSLYHRITSRDLFDGVECYEKEKDIEKLYVDLLPNNGILELILEESTTFLVGRRGTGKSTIFSRAQHEIHKKKKNLSVYLNASTIFSESEVGLIQVSTDLSVSLTVDERLKITLIKNIVSGLINGLKEELESENNGFFEGIKNIYRDSKLNELVLELNKMLDEEVFENITKVLISDIENEEKFKNVIDGKISLTDASLTVGIEESGSNHISNTMVFTRAFKINEIIKKFLSILDICKRNSIFIFIDDYSELDYDKRKIFMESIISPMYAIGARRIHFKIACYPNKIEPITLPRGKYIVKSIDLFDIYGKDNNIPNTEKLAIDYTKKLIENRVRVYYNGNIQDLFDTKTISLDEYYRYLYYVSQNVPRVLGHVLHTCGTKTIVYDKPITLSTLNEASKQYYNDHIRIDFDKEPFTVYEDTEEKVDVFVQESIVNQLINIAQQNKYELPKEDNSFFEGIDKAPTSHFTISEKFDLYLEDLEFKGFVHKINKIAAKGREKETFKNETNYLYAFDYGLCQEEKILYGRPKDAPTKYYQQRVFVYNDILIGVLEKNKKIVCKSCGAEYSIQNLEIMQQYRMMCNTCFKGICEIRCDMKLKEKALSQNNEAIWSPQEFNVIHTIFLLSNDGDSEITANIIGKEIDCNSNMVAATCKKLAHIGYIERNKNVQPFKYSLTERSREILSLIGSTKE